MRRCELGMALTLFSLRDAVHCTSGHILLTNGFLGSCGINLTQTLALTLGDTLDGVFRPFRVCCKAFMTMEPVVRIRGSG